ncbi:MAG: DIP1984 family protein [Rhodothermales bacterium]
MKLAEALLLRADLQKRIAQVRSRLLRNAKVQEGDAPAEDPQTLLATLEADTQALETLIQYINHTNSQARLDSGISLTAALAKRDVLRLKAGAYRELAEAATVTHDRYSRSEVKFVSTIKVRDIQREADGLSKQLRELDAAIQAANWNVDLLE